MSVVECPGCGAVYEDVRLQKTAAEFCGRCDYPLFWAARRDHGAEAALAADGSLQPTLRRRPGAAGLQLPVDTPCPVCREPNPPAAAVCLRCGASMVPAPPRPAPVVVSPPSPPPPPVPAPPLAAPAPPRRSMVPIVIAVLAAVLAVQLLVLLLR